MNKTTKTITGFITAAALIAGGGAVTDAQINPYVDKGQTLEIVADSIVPQAGKNQVELIKDRPEIRLKKWGGQVDMGITYSKVDAIGNRVLFTDRMEWKGDKEEVHAYPLEAKAGMEDGGFEIEIILKEKPATNTFEFAIDGWEELDFFYQPPLTQSDIDEGVARPENVVGSYAVYHKTKKNYTIGKTNYTTGKAFHIYRPKIIDANNNQVWGELNYQGGVLTVIVPQSFLDTATYPVIVDPTIGYTSVGASTSSFGFHRIMGTNRASTTDATGGTISSISVYASSPGSNKLFRGAIYDASLNLLSPQSGEVTVNSATPQWWNAVFTGPSLTANTNYVPAVIHNAAASPNFFNMYTDSGGNLGDFRGTGVGAVTYPTWNDPVSFLDGTSILSLYATYNPAQSFNNNTVTFE